jgi:hypothetical protein
MAVSGSDGGTKTLMGLYWTGTKTRVYFATLDNDGIPTGGWNYTEHAYKFIKLVRGESGYVTAIGERHVVSLNYTGGAVSSLQVVPSSESDILVDGVFMESATTVKSGYTCNMYALCSSGKVYYAYKRPDTNTFLTSATSWTRPQTGSYPLRSVSYSHSASGGAFLAVMSERLLYITKSLNIGAYWFTFAVPGILANSTAQMTGRGLVDIGPAGMFVYGGSPNGITGRVYAINPTGWMRREEENLTSNQ